MVGESETVEMQLDSRVIILLIQKDFCGAIALTYFVENCLDLPQQYLRNEDISKVLVILFRKINTFSCDKRFITFVQMGLYLQKTCKSLILFTNANMHT